MLFTISEPQSPTVLQAWKLAVGIDLGTSNSLVAVWRDGVATCLSDEQGAVLIPSVVHYSADGAVHIGEAALLHGAHDARNTIVSVKRFMGRALADIPQIETYPYDFHDHGETFGIRTVQGVVTPIEVSAEILKAIRQRVRHHYPDLLSDDEPLPAVITVPAYFDDAQRQATKAAAQLANIRVLRLLNEPTAAALAYGLDNHPTSTQSEREGTFVVYDLGGGTFDVSVLSLERGVFQVLATHGDTALGGDDFDRKMYCWVLDELRLPPPENEVIRALQWRVKKAREHLSTHELSPIYMESPIGAITTTITRNKMVAITKDLVDKTLIHLRSALRDAKLTINDIDGVVLVGGATRMPHVHLAVEHFFHRAPYTDVDPDKVVAQGAARQAYQLIGNKSQTEEHLLLDILPLSLGLETYGGLTERIITRNTVIPITREQEFTTQRDGQNAMIIHVVQGERELVRDNRSLARFTLRGIPPLSAGAARIRVTFQVDADGLLIVTAREMTTGMASQIEVKPSFGLSTDAIATMIAESMKNAQDDGLKRSLTEHKVEAEALLNALTKALDENGTLLSGDERQTINQAMAAVHQAVDENSTDALRETIAKLSQVSEDFAHRRMNVQINHALRGQTI